LPEPADIDTSGLEIDDDVMQALLSVDIDQWNDEMTSVGEYLESYGDRLPKALRAEHAAVVEALKKAG
jgi:phosphoenolpyruvate carboxykinase (GTP)